MPDFLHLLFYDSMAGSLCTSKTGSSLWLGALPSPFLVPMPCPDPVWQHRLEHSCCRKGRQLCFAWCGSCCHAAACSQFNHSSLLLLPPVENLIRFSTVCEQHCQPFTSTVLSHESPCSMGLKTPPVPGHTWTSLAPTRCARIFCKHKGKEVCVVLSDDVCTTQQ